MLDEGVAEQGARGFGGDQTFGGLIERRGQAPVRRMFAVVGVPFDGCIRLDAMLDSPKPGADGCGERDVRIDIRGCNPVLDPLARRTAADHAQRGRAVLDPPGRRGRCPITRDEARVAVHGARNHGEELGHQRLLAADEPAHGVRHLMRLRDVVEHALAGGGAQRNVQMAALTRNVLGPLGHERRHQTVALREHLGIGLEERRAIGGLEGIAVGEGGFENPGAGFGVQALDRKSHGLA